MTLTTGPHILLSCVYRRPRGLLLNDFFNIYLKLGPDFKNCIIAGDLNCNLLVSDTAANHLKTFICDSSLYCVRFGATYHEQNSDSWQDVIIVDSENKVGKFFKSSVPFINGHDFLFCEYIINYHKLNNKQITYRNFKNCNHAELSSLLANSFDSLIQSLF